MITINVMGDSICGSVNNEQFGIPFSAKKLKEMNNLQEKANTVSDMAEYKAIIEEFTELIKVDYKEIIESECPNIYINKATGTYHLKTGKEISSVAMPEALVDRIKDSIDKKIDFKPLLKMWTRWLRNPILRQKLASDKGSNFSERMFNYINAEYTNFDTVRKLEDESGVSEEVAIERATTYQVGITVEGLLRTFKVSTEVETKYILDDEGNKKVVDRKQAESIDPDTGLITYTELSNEERLFKPAMMGDSGDAFYCGDTEGHFIKVGQLHKLSDWSKVNTNDNQSCVKGLHCGGLDYINGYQNSGTETHNILVDPMNIGAVPCDEAGAIRVLEYFVLDAFSGVNGSIYHSSTYAAQSDTKWEEDRKEIISEFGTLAEDIKAKTAELNSI